MTVSGPNPGDITATLVDGGDANTCAPRASVSPAAIVAVVSSPVASYENGTPTTLTVYVPAAATATTTSQRSPVRVTTPGHTVVR